MNSIASQSTTGYVRYVGRVGGLAIALGVGAAIAALAPTASADATPSSEGPSAAKSHPRPSQATDSTPTRRVPTSRPTALTPSSAAPKGLGNLPRLFGNGTPDHPDGGIFLGNGYSWTAQTCTTGNACKGGNGGFLGNGGNGFNGGDGGAAGWFGHGGNGGSGVNDGAGGDGGTGGLFFGDGGNGGEGSASISDNGTGGNGGDGGDVGRWGSGKGGNGGDGADGYVGGTGGDGGSGALLGGLREAQLSGIYGAHGISSSAALSLLAEIHIPGGLVTAIAVNTLGKDTYVVSRVNQYVAALSVIDTANNTFVSNIPVDGVPTSVAVGYRLTPPHIESTAYATIGRASVLKNDKVSVIDTRTDAPVATVDSPSTIDPFNIVLAPYAREAYFLATRKTAVTDGARMVAIMNTDTNEMTSIIKLTHDASSMAVEPFGKFLYVTHPTANTVSVIDIGKKSLVKTINVGENPVAVVFGAGHFAYVANKGSGTVTVIDTSKQLDIASIGMNGRPTSLAVSPNGSTVYVKKEDNSLSLIDSATAIVLDNIPALTDYASGGMAISADGTKLYLGQTGAVVVYALKTEHT